MANIPLKNAIFFATGVTLFMLIGSLWSSPDYSARISSKSIEKTSVKKVFDENVSPAKKTQIETAALEKYIKRKRAVMFNPDVFEEKKGKGQAKGLSLAKAKKRKITLDLFPDKRISAVRKEIKGKSDTNFTWKGRIEGESLSAVTLMVRGDKVSGIIRSVKGDFEIRSEGGGVHSIQEIAMSLLANHFHLVPERPSTLTAQAPPPPPPAEVATVTTIDVMTSYSENAFRGLLNSEEEMARTIELYIEDANAAFETSNVLIRLNLVGEPYRPNYTEAANDVQIDLARLGNGSDGFMDDIHRVRNERQADVVFLFEGGGDDACGVAYQLNRDNWDFFDTNAFSVIRLGCLRVHALAHELGHILGAGHNREDMISWTPYDTYSYGYRDSSVRTIMSYPCPSVYPSYRECPMVSAFSSPNLRVGNTTIGATDTNNARTLNNTRNIAAGWRGGINIPRALQNLQNFPLP